MSRYFLLFLCLFSANCFSAPRMNHHGEYILKCHKPLFFDEIPANDSVMEELQDFSITASDNTDMATIKFSVNNEPFDAILERKRSGRILITGHLKNSITQKGIVLLKVWSESNDGCIGLKAWRVHMK